MGLGSLSQLVTQGPGKVISRALGLFPLSENTTHLKLQLHQRFLLTPPQALIPRGIWKSACAQTPWSGGQKATRGLLSTRHILPSLAVPQGSGAGAGAGGASSGIISPSAPT